MKVIRNPFHMGPIQWGQPFCDRERELEILLQEAENSNLVVLYGPRRFGKTSLLNQLEGRLGKDWIRLSLDFTFVPNLGELAIRLDEAIGKVLPRTRRILRAFEDKRLSLEFSVDPVTSLPSVDFGLKSAGSDSSVSRVLQRLELLIALPEITGKSVLVTFDEFQEVVYATDNKKQIYEKLVRGVFQKRPPGFCAVFSGSKNTVLRKMFSDRARMFFRGARSLNVDGLEQEPFTQFAKDNFSKTLQRYLPDPVSMTVHRLLEGHPYGLQKVMHNLWNCVRGTRKGDVNWPEYLKITLRDVLAEEVLAFQAHIAQLTPVQRKVLQAISEMKPDGQSLFSKDTLKKMGIAQSTVALSVKALTEKGFLTKIPEMERDRYAVTDIIDRLCLAILRGTDPEDVIKAPVAAVRSSTSSTAG
jgi:DNA-binding MarR family transcriptional regulator